MDAVRRSLQELPADQQLELVVLKNDVDTSLRDAHAAEAAVGAVAQVHTLLVDCHLACHTCSADVALSEGGFTPSVES
jgi:hypothetical protein